jgi:hypothetical protein
MLYEDKEECTGAKSRQLVLILAGAVCNIWDFFLVHSYVRIGLYLCSTVTYCWPVLKNKKLKKMLHWVTAEIGLNV